MTTVEVLRKARTLVARGWCQKKFELDGSYCAVGAIKTAAMPIESTDEWVNTKWAAIRALRAGNPSILPPPPRDGGSRYVDDVFRYNDAPGRTQAEVVELFDAAIRYKENA